MSKENTRMEDGGWKMAKYRLRHPLFSMLYPRLQSIHPSEGAGAAVATPTATSLGTLLTRHILRDGEIVLLLLKPSIWFILLSSLRFVAIVVILTSAIFLFDIDDRMHANRLSIIEPAIFLIGG